MDLKLFKLDIDELINEFTESESTTLAEFRRVWLSRKFSYIFEGSPSTNQGFFMQSLYAHCIRYMISAVSLSSRLAGLYCFYCLYETQPFKPPYKIYLSLGELSQLKNLVVDAKTNGVKVVAALIKSMLERDIFLFGSVGITEGSATERVDELTDVQNARVQAAYKKLFANSRLDHFIHMDMGMELDVDLLKKQSSEYAAAKELAINEASQVIDVENIKHIADNKRLIGDMVEKTATDWVSQKESFYEKTGLRHFQPPHQENNEQQSCEENRNQKEACDNVEGNENFEKQDDFDKELEEALLFEELECEDEDAEPTDADDL